MRGLIKDIEELMGTFEMIEIKQRYRESNSVADYLAKEGAIRDLDGIWFASPPIEVVRMLADDVVGRAVIRTVGLSS